MSRAHRYNKRNIYAAYRGEQYIMEGTADELAKTLGVSRNYILWVQYPAAVKRAEVAETRRKYRSKGRLHVVLVEEVVCERTKEMRRKRHE